MKRKIIVSIFFGMLICGVTFVWAAGSYLTKPVPLAIEIAPAGANSVNFMSSSGSELSGWVYPAPESIAIAVLMHGLRSNRNQMVARAERLQSIGITTLVFDFQGHGESPGDLITLGYLESLDAQSAVAFLKDFMPDLPLLVLGVSMGGAAALLAEPSIGADLMILESVYPDVTTAIGNRLAARIPGGRLLTPLLSYQIKPRLGVSARDLSPVDRAANVQAATLVLSGREDLHTTVEDTYNLFKALPEPKELNFIDEAGHDDLEHFNSDVYWRIVETFLSEHLTVDA